ncbi:MAG: hypothetical protein AB7L09_08325 [Nitrospira sp.]
MLQHIIVEGFDIVQPFRSGQPPESDTCREILEDELWGRTNLPIERRQAFGPYELNQKNEHDVSEDAARSERIELMN